MDGSGVPRITYEIWFVRAFDRIPYELTDPAKLRKRGLAGVFLCRNQS